MEEYIVSNVLPTIAEGLISIRRKQPDDPIQYMYEHLVRAADTIQSHAEQEAYQTFCNLLQAQRNS